jgi:type III secretion protein V
LVDPAYLRTLTTTAGQDLFPFMREGLFQELGVHLPSFRVHRDPSLRAGGFAFRLAGAEVPPRIGLAEGTLLVNDTAEQLALLGITGRPTLNPATGHPAAIVPADHAAQLDALGYTTWTPPGHLVLCFADALRRYAYRYVTEELVDRVLALFRRFWPDLVDCVDALLTRAELTGLLRELVREQVSIRNVRRIMELLLRCATEGVPAEERLAVVRSGLAEQITAKAARGTSTVVVYLLDPALERAVTDGVEPDARVRLRRALAQEMAHLPPTAQVPVILTQDDCRGPVRDALLPQFPRLSVLGHRDLTPDVNVQPVARVSEN